MKKSNYLLLFEQQYEYYKQNGDNDRTWSSIIKTLGEAGWIDMMFKTSKIYGDLYEDAYSYCLMSVVNAFRSYKDDKNASLFTYATLLMRQSIWHFIQDTCRQNKIFNTANNDYEEYEKSNNQKDVENDYIEKEQEDVRKDKLYCILTKVIRNTIYLQVYCTKNGIFGYEKKTKEEEIAEYLGLTIVTVHQALIDNKKKIWLFKQWLKENKGDTSKLTKETFNAFCKKKNKKITPLYNIEIE